MAKDEATSTEPKSTGKAATGTSSKPASTDRSPAPPALRPESEKTQPRPSQDEAERLEGQRRSSALPSGMRPAGMSQAEWDKQVAEANQDLQAAAARNAGTDARSGGRPPRIISHKLRPGDPCPECGLAIADELPPPGQVLAVFGGPLTDEDRKKAEKDKDFRGDRAVEWHYARYHAAAQIPQTRTD